jgi:hypothetical protein
VKTSKEKKMKKGEMSYPEPKHSCSKEEDELGRQSV